MFTGNAAELRKLERKAASLAEQIEEALNEIDALGLGQVIPGNGKIAGPGFTIRRRGTRWTVDH